MRISMRLLWLFLLVSVLPLALFSYVDLQNEAATLRAEAQNRLSSLADKKVTQIRDYLQERKREVGIRARGPQVVEAMAHFSQTSAARRGSADARLDALLRRYFGRHVEETGLFNDVFLITPQGGIVYSQKHEADFATNLLVGPYRESQLAQAFRNTRLTLEPVISGYEYYAPSSAPALFIAAPVMLEGRFIGVFAAQLDNKHFLRVAQDVTGLGMSGEAIFGQRDGNDALFTVPLKYRDDAALKFRVKPGESVAVPMLPAVSGESGSGVKQDYRGRPVVAAWRYLPELEWGIVTKIDADEALASIGEHRRLTLGSLLGLSLLAGLAAYFFGRRISVPLNRLAQAAGEIAATGNPGRRADETAPGELGLLARTFNQMTEKLQELHRTLEGRIEERTRKLSAMNEELLNNQRLLDEAQRLGKLGSWELNLATGGLKWSDEVFRLFELDPAQFQPSYENFLSVIHPDDRDKVNRAYTQSLENRQPYDIEHRLRMADGRIKWVHEHCASDFDASGKALRSVGAVQDITERKLAEDALRVAAATFDSQEAIVITDADANILRVNQAFTGITGYVPGEVLGRNPRVLSSRRESSAFYAEMWRQLLEAGSWSGELWDKHKDGRIYLKWLTITAIKDAQGSVTEYVGIFTDITARKQAEEEIHNLAFYDALTKLPNRRLLLDRFHLALSGSARSRHYGAVLFLDMDRFKVLNDTLGHDYGDLLLIEVAGRLRYCVREADTVARFGGDEFVVLIEEISTDMQDASQRVALVAEKIRATLAAPYQLKEYEHHSSPSIGICLYRGNEEAVDDLLKHADLAMYQAKGAGRNLVRFFDPVMQQAVEMHAALEADLRRALPNRELHLYYQIQVDSAHHSLGAEALIRWVHPKHGMVSPARFIPVAEDSALILEIGHWVMDTACRQLAAWSGNERMRDLTLAVNVSAQQFRQHDFVDRVTDVLRAHRINPSRLKLELTESVVLGDVADVVAKMHALKALGVKLSLDDFGTGYSSLSYLKQLPLDQIKIDQSFVRDIVTDSNDAVMVKTIIDMAQNFGLDVIAEGVETEEQLEFLKQNGCLAYQGYLFSKPVPIGEFEALLGRGT